MARRRKRNFYKSFIFILIGLIIFPLVYFIRKSSITLFNRAAVTTKNTLVSNANVGFMGDLNIGRFVNKNAFDNDNYVLFDTKMGSFLKANQLNVANFESTIIDKNANGISQCPVSGSGDLMIFCGSPKFVPQFASNKFLFNLANNHIKDFESIDGRKRTMEELDKYSIPYVYSHDPKTEYVQKTLNGIKFGFLGISFASEIPYTQDSLKKVTDLIKKYDSRVDWLVLSVHWGQEYTKSPSKTQIEYAHAFIDAGADVIHGHHPHVLQPYEWYKNKIIFYSLGNFVFDQDFDPATRTSAIYRVTFTKNSISRIEEAKIEIPKDGKTKITSLSTVYIGKPVYKKIQQPL